MEKLTKHTTLRELRKSPITALENELQFLKMQYQGFRSREAENELTRSVLIRIREVRKEINNRNREVLL